MPQWREVPPLGFKERRSAVKAGCFPITCWFVLSTLVCDAGAAIIYVGDTEGHIVQYDTSTLQLTSVGNLGDFFPVVRVMGLAYDPSTDAVLILDRDAYKVYSMNSQTGTASFLFTTWRGTQPQPWDLREFQGGAVVNGLLYGIDEVSQTVEAYSLTTSLDQELSAPVALEHSHGLGADVYLGHLYSAGGNGVIREVSTDGTIGPILLQSSTAFFYNDIDYWQGNFVAVTPERGIDLIDATGLQSVLVPDSALTAAGINTVTGIALRAPAVSSVSDALPRPILVSAFPNPTRGGASTNVLIRPDVRLSEKSSKIRVRIFDVHGRLVRDLFDGELGGERALTWDARDRRGQQVPFGVYFINLEVDGSFARSTRVVRVAP